MNSVSKLALGLAFLAASATISADEQKVIKKSKETTVQQASQNEIAPVEEKKSEVTDAEIVTITAAALCAYALYQRFGAPAIDQIDKGWLRASLNKFADIWLAVFILDGYKETVKTIKEKTVNLAKGATRMARRAYAEAAC